MPVAAVFGSSTALSAERCCIQAYELGRGLARLGFSVKNGGYHGVMEAVSRGVAEAGGEAIGVTLVGLSAPEPGSGAVDAALRTANPHLTLEVSAPDLLDRLRVLVDGTDIFFAMETGGPGTLNEVFLVWAMALIGEIADRPLVLVGSGWPELMSVLEDHFRLGRESQGMVRIVSDVDAALEVAREVAGR